MKIDIQDAIAKKLDSKLNKEAQEVTPAVMETDENIAEGDVVDSETVEVAKTETTPLSSRSDKLAGSVERLLTIAGRYSFRPFVEAAKAVEKDFRDLKSGVDLIS